MDRLAPSIADLIAAAVCLALAAIVLTRNQNKTTHRAFALLAVNLMLWAIGVVAVIQSRTESMAHVSLIFTEMVACFIPAIFYRFVAYFPEGTFEGNKTYLKFLYALGTLLAVGTLSPWYISEVILVPNHPATVAYGPLYTVFPFMLVATTIAMMINLSAKFRRSKGFGRRQIQHVILGISCMAILSIGILFVGPLFGLNSPQAYGPATTMAMLSFFAYAMIRYHLLDTRILLFRSIVFSILTFFVVTTLVSVVYLVEWAISGTLEISQLISAFLASLLVVILFQTVKERVQEFIASKLLTQRYDVNHLYARIAEQASEELQLEPLLKTVAEDIRDTVGVSTIRVLLLDEHDPSLLRSAFTTLPDEGPIETRGHEVLLDYLRANAGPLLLEKVLLNLNRWDGRNPDTNMAKVAEHLAALDAYFCLPLKTSAGLVGIMTLGQKDSHDIYTEEEVVAFRALGGPLGTAIANARLYQELDDVNMHLSGIFKQMREGVIAVDTQGYVTTVNEAANNIVGNIKIGYTLEQLRPEIAMVLRTTLDEERAVSEFESRILGADDKMVDVILSSSCLRAPGNGTTGAVALIYDLTQIKTLEQNVISADRLSSIGTLAAGMAHEIKNPLVSIKTFSDLLLSRYDDSDFRNTFRDIVPGEVDRIDTIVSRLLDFARPRPVNFEALRVRTIIAEVLALVENQTRKLGVQVATHFPVKAAFIRGDEQQLHQVFLNLILNAIEAMEEATQRKLDIDVKLDYVRLRAHGVPSSTETECVKLRIKDTGCGIPEANISELFTPFFSTKTDGCGLGLAVVHGIITEHGGDIQVISTEGEGTTFTVILPLAKVLVSTQSNV